MLKFIEKDTVSLNPMIKHIIMMLKYGKKSRNSFWAKSNMAKEMVTDYYNSLSSEDIRSLTDIFSEIGFYLIKEYEYIRFGKGYPRIDNTMTDQQKEILRSLFGEYTHSNIYVGDSFSIRCDKLLKKIVNQNKSNFNVLDLIEEEI